MALIHLKYPHHPRMLVLSFILEKMIFKVCQYILLFPYYLPLEKGMALHLNKYDFLSPKDALCQVWLKLALGFWRRRFFQFRQYIFTIL